MVLAGTSCTNETKQTENISTPQDSNNKEGNRIDRNEIFIKDHPLLKNTPFYTTTIDNIKEKCPENLNITYSEESADGHFTYYKGDGIIYITAEDGSLFSVILTNNNYEFNCGFKVGMNESEISNLGIPFNKYNKDEIGVNKKIYSYLLGFKTGPLSMFDFDKLYYYKATLCDDKVISYNGRCIGLMAFMKDGKLIAVCTDWPNAN
jgi:hypothetical protein